MSRLVTEKMDWCPDLGKVGVFMELEGNVPVNVSAEERQRIINTKLAKKARIAREMRSLKSLCERMEVLLLCDAEALRG